jgi:hypothetical protein
MYPKFPRQILSGRSASRRGSDSRQGQMESSATALLDKSSICVPGLPQGFLMNRPTRNEGTSTRTNGRPESWRKRFKLIGLNNETMV